MFLRRQSLLIQSHTYTLCRSSALSKLKADQGSAPFIYRDLNNFLIATKGKWENYIDANRV